jgi:hypothetical protein
MWMISRVDAQLFCAGGQEQPTTGRGDGENYQIGFLDICDRPYPEIVQAARQIGRSMYEYRSEN